MADCVEAVPTDQAAYGGMRRRLKTTRQGYTRQVSHGGLDLQVTINFNDDEPAEMFIHSSATGSDMAGLLHTIAVTASLALQYGVPWRKINEKWRGMRFGTVQTDDALSVVDAIAAAVEAICESRHF